MLNHFKTPMLAGLFAGTMALSGSGFAGTFVVDGTEATYTRLSDAVTSAVESGPGPHTINITTNTLSLPDTEVVVSQPMTIEGDADNDGIPCDILVDTVKMAPDSYVSPGYPGVEAANVKTYLELNTPGQVTINNLKIHPNGPNTTTIARRRVNAVRMYVPLNQGEVGNYTLNNVKISGSDANLNYVALDTKEDLYNTTPNRWAIAPSHQGSVILMERLPDGAQGTYNAVLNNCHAGLGQSGAVSIMNTSGTAVINGGLYGHSSRDGINIEGTDVTITGSPTNRLRVVQAPHMTGVNAHGIRVWSSATVNLLEYADVMSTTTGVNFNFNGGNVAMMRYCRGLGKPQSLQNTAYAIGLGTVNIKDTTFNGSGINANPFQIGGTFDGQVNITDSIFTSEIPGLIRNDNADAVGVLSISNSGIASDGYVGETLQDPPTTSTAADPGANLVLANNTSASPRYLLPASAYDWSDAQGATNPLNGAGNMNVLRPTNVAYLTASSTGGPLVGGAGPLPAGIDADVWMLME